MLPAPPPAARRRAVEMTIDGVPVTVPQGSTILEACRAQGIDIPTLCYAGTLTPEGVCRMCVVDTGGRALMPSCSAKVTPGMSVETDNDRVRHSRKLVLELLGSSVDVDLAGPVAAGRDHRAGTWSATARTRRGSGRRRQPSAAGERDARQRRPPPRDRRGRRPRPSPSRSRWTTTLFVRDYARCILCYKCVEACGEDAQNTFAISVAGRGFDARVSTEFDTPLDVSACVFCGNCINVCPTGALMFRSEYEMREDGTWDEAAQHVVDTICPYCGVGCTLSLHVQDNRIVKVLSPLESEVTAGQPVREGPLRVRLRPGAAEGRARGRGPGLSPARRVDGRRGRWAR